MLAKEQEETYQTINEFYGVADELINHIEQGMDHSDCIEVVDKLDMVESLISDMMDFSEVMTDKSMNQPEYLTSAQRDDLEKRMVELLISLNKCRDILMNILN